MMIESKIKNESDIGEINCVMYETYFKFKTYCVLHNNAMLSMICKVFTALMRVYLNTVKTWLYKVRLNTNVKTYRGEVYVSLTSFPARIEKVYLTIMSLYEQTVKPKGVILWLSKDQFPGLQGGLPKELKLLQKNKGLTIKFVDDDIKSFKKFKYMLDYYPDEDFIVVDDDVFYPPKTIERLTALHKEYPKDICCMSAVEISNVNSLPSKWHGDLNKKLYHVPYLRIIGIGGVYYPAGSLYHDASNMELVLELCPWADDMWLTMQALVNKTYFTKYFTHSNPIEVAGTQTATLSGKNKLDFAKKLTNDDQWKSLMNYYREQLQS